MVVDVAMRTSAARTYFPTYQHYIDGGVVANNPSVAALAQALDQINGANQPLTDIRLLSIGTGTVATFIGGADHDWGLAQWAQPLVSLMIDGVMGVADYQCQQLLRACYYRLSPLLPLPIAMDEVNSIQELLDLANAVPLEEVVQWLNGNF